MRRSSWYVFLAILVVVVNDGWSGRPGPLLHQVILVPLELLFAAGLVGLFRGSGTESLSKEDGRIVGMGLGLCLGFEVISILSFRYEAMHFAQFGYLMLWPQYLSVAVLALLAAFGFLRYRSGTWLMGGSLAAFSGGELLSIRSFPLNYLRSDMLPVVQWADERLIHHLSPYATMYVGDRVYDFPYLPGVLLEFLPAIGLGIDPRWINLICVVALAGLLYRESIPGRRLIAAVFIALFVLSPFLQYRHDLYLAPHWLLLTGAIILLQKRRDAAGAIVFGLSMAVYQLSWVLWPFLLLYALRTRSWVGVVRTGVLSSMGMAVVIAPFARLAYQRIASNTVGQWSRLPHALAEPMNLSYWVTYLVRPDQLKWVQLAVLTVVFLYCLAAKRCHTLEDTLRWMGIALAIFITLNVLVDGYFYLTLLLLLLMYTLSAEGIWPKPGGDLTKVESFSSGVGAARVGLG